MDTIWNMIAYILRPCSKGATTMSNAYIKDGRIYGVSISEYFNVMLSDDENPSICPRIVLDHMPVKVMAKLVHEALKVRGRPMMKKMDLKTLKKTYKGDVSWRVLFSKDGAAQHRAQIAMSNEELDAEIERLKVLQTQLDEARLKGIDKIDENEDEDDDEGEDENDK